MANHEGMMDKRQFLKTSGAFAATAFLPGITSAEQKDMSTNTKPRTNWSGNLTYHTTNLFEPATVADLQQVIKDHPSIRPLGTRHSFNPIADSTQAQVSLKNFTQIKLDEQAKTVTVGAGVRYGDVAPVIDAKGFALHNLASLPHISVPGAIATGTHGSGLHNRNLSSSVAAIEFVAADGTLHTLSRAHDGEQFNGAVVNLGLLGVMTNLTLDVEPTFQVAQTVYTDIPFAELEHHFDDIFGAGYSVSIFTDWQHSRGTELWLKRKVTPGQKLDTPELFYNAKLATKDLHPIPALDAVNCTPQMGVPGPWYERLPHFRMNFTPSSGEELQTEYFVPREHGYEAIRAVETLRDRITPHLLTTELRTIAADQLWMSMAYHRDSLAIHFTWKRQWPEVQKILPLIEAKLQPFHPRPHWAKLFTFPPAQLRAAYPKLEDFKQLVRQYDPQGKFRNDFIYEALYS
jgi:alditol oxidase